MAFGQGIGNQLGSGMCMHVNKTRRYCQSSGIQYPACLIHIQALPDANDSFPPYGHIRFNTRVPQTIEDGPAPDKQIVWSFGGAGQVETV